MSQQLLTIKQTSDLLGVTTTTLRDWDKSGKLTPIRTKGGHRRYRLSDIQSCLGDAQDEKQNTNIVCVYARVSSHEQKQKGDLDRQKQRLIEYCANQGYKLEHVLTDVGSGMSDNRTKLKTLFNLVREHKINKVIIEHKDRLTRFQFNVFVEFFGSHGVDIEYVESSAIKSYEQELVDDIIALMASFSGKIYGKRSAERKKK